mgnify:CR=1 FL=1
MKIFLIILKKKTKEKKSGEEKEKGKNKHPKLLEKILRKKELKKRNRLRKLEKESKI